jgi:hypothetical protein
VSEIIKVEKWLYSRLSGVTGVSGRVYTAVAPKGSTFPFILYEQRALNDILTQTDRPIACLGSWLVRVVGKASGYVELQAITDAVNYQLDRVRIDPVMQCLRVQGFSMTEVIDEVQYRHLGGIYDVIVIGG